RRAMPAWPPSPTCATTRWPARVTTCTSSSPTRCSRSWPGSSDERGPKRSGGPRLPCGRAVRRPRNEDVGPVTARLFLHEVGDADGVRRWRDLGAGWVVPDLPGHGVVPPEEGAYYAPGDVALVGVRALTAAGRDGEA